MDAIRRVRHPLTLGFTIIELLVVVVIIALLMGMLMPHLGRSKRESLILKEQVNMRSVGQATVVFAHEHKDRVPEAYGTVFSANPLSGTPTLDGGNLTQILTPGWQVGTPTLPANSISAQVAKGKGGGYYWGLGQLVVTGCLTSPDLLFSTDPNSSGAGKADDFVINQGSICSSSSPTSPYNLSFSGEYIYMPHVLKQARADGTWNKFRTHAEMKGSTVVEMNNAYHAINDWQPWHTGVSGNRKGDLIVNALYADGHVSRHNTATETTLKTNLNGETISFNVPGNFYTGMGGSYAGSGSKVVDYLERNP